MKKAFTLILILIFIAGVAYKLGLFPGGLRLSSIAPDSAKPGDEITLTGSGFGTDARMLVVEFNEIQIRPSTVTDSSMTVFVPPGARSGMVSVRLGDQVTNALFLKVEEAKTMPAGHPETMKGSSMQAAPPSGEGSEEMPSPQAHEFYSPDEAKPFIDFTLPNKKGEQVSLASYRGKVVAVNFWATWCKPCLEEVPSLERLTKRSKTMDLVVLAVSVDKNFEDIEKALPNTNLNILLDPESKVAHQYGTMKFPETWIINKEGKIVARFIGSRNWDSGLFEQFFSLLIEGKGLPSMGGGGH